MQRLISICLFYVLFTTTFTKGQDSTCKILDYITFHSEVEKNELSKKCISGRADPLLLFLSSCNRKDTMQIQIYADRFEDFYARLNAMIKPSWKEEKKIKKVFGQVHNHFLNKYELKADFYEIFETGTYNCVTASAFYAIIFEKLKIPYDVKETPQHVFLVAYPETKGIKVETVDPVTGYYIPDESYKKLYIKYLNSQKIISDSEMYLKSTDDLFEEYYYGKESTDLTGILGIHYYNDAVVEFNNEHYKSALDQIGKSLAIYSNEPIKYMAYASLVKVVENLSYDKISDARYVTMMGNFLELGMKRENIVYEFNRITAIHLINNGNEELYSSFYDEIMAGISDSLLNEEVSLIYSYEMGRDLFNRGQKESAYQYFRKAMDIRPNNSDIQLAFVQSLVHNVQNMDHEEAVTIIEAIYREYSSLNNNTLFINVMLTAYLLSAHRNLMIGKSSSGFSFIAKFEKLYSSNKGIEIDTNLVGEVYSSAAVYYYKRGMKSKARMIIEKGLEYAPHNYLLQYSLTSF